MTDKDQEYWSVRRPSAHAFCLFLIYFFTLGTYIYHSYHISFSKAELMSLLGLLEPLLIWLIDSLSWLEWLKLSLVARKRPS